MSNFNIKQIKHAIRRALKSKSGHNTMLYLLFACVAFIFWFFLSLDNEVQRDLEVPLIVENVPDSVVMLNEPPKRITVVVLAKGSQLIPYVWGHMSSLKIKFTPNLGGDGVFSLSRARLEARVREYFGQSTQILSLRPDSLYLPYTTSRGKKVPLKVIADIKPTLQCVVNGNVTCSTDSVTLYSSKPLPTNIQFAETEKLVLNNLRDTVTVTANVKPIPGVRIIPGKVRIRIPVEPLIAKRKQASIGVINLPDGIGFLTFPSVAEINYLVPMSRYNDDYPFKLYVNFNDVTLHGQKIKVRLAPYPEIYRNVTTSVDSVEFVMEKRNQ